MAVILLFFHPMAGVSSVLHVFLVVAGVTAVVVVIVAVVVVKKWWRVILATRTEEKYTLRREGVGKKSSVLVMYSPDNLVHLNTVSQFIVHLRKHLRCKVYDIFEKEDTEKMADPNWWLLEKMSAKFSMKVVLVLSEGVTQLLQTLLDGQELMDINDSQRNSAERSTFTDIDLNNAKFLTAGLKRLLNQDFVHNYSRLFVVSIGEVETMRDSAINLLVHSRRYRLPEHWSHLVDALSGPEDGVQLSDI
ncbi:uncharacterized protein LOC121868348 isoform X3 [Homarus americanus]|uniref:uncharacterized protein LOC121868348 isoform X3 n=1 Tax=Homarus americanus TaxID=6706 RepID=UPI001C462486|nr:uncharacterized protein LOC121868348 isoform X3 [Homarus americanus]